MDDLKFACPRCGASLSLTLFCSACSSAFDYRDGVYRFLLPERELEFEPFLSQYRQVRQQEGNFARPSDYYRSLPIVQPLTLDADRWYIRRQSYECLLSLLPKHSAILDLGAGNCWLTHRLTALGYRCVAIDTSTDSDDGLGAWRHYGVKFTCVQADFDALSFAPSQFDVAIFNASLHYAPDIHRSLANANRMLKPNGVIFVIDSPVFQTDRAGKQMLADQDEYFRTSCNLRQVIRHGIGYLTRAQMREAGFRFHPSRGGFLWNIRRLWSGIKLRREPAAFGVWEGKPQ